MIFCLMPNEVNKMKSAIRSGKLSPDKLNVMTSQQRRDFLATIIGTENARQVNLLFEKKLLLKNQEKAMYDWARGITGLSTEQKAETLRKIRQTYAEKKRRLEDPKVNEVFLNEIVSDVYSRKFNTEITLEEAQTITELSQDRKRAREKVGDNFKSESISDGVAKVALDNYVGGLKADAQKVLFVNPLKVRGLSSAASMIKTDAKLSGNFIAENARALKASFDNSLWGRQAIKVLFTHPKIWVKNFNKSWVDIAKVLAKGNKAGDAIMDATKAEIYSRENFRNGRYQMGKKLDIGTGEEEFPTSAPSKIPVLGRPFRAAEVAYEAGAMRMRADLADLTYKMAEDNEVDLTNEVEVGAINDMVNYQTGRGSLGSFERAGKTINVVFFSAKFAKSNIDTLTKMFTAKSSFAKKQAAINLLKIVSSIAIILATADTLDDDSVEWDPRSANFGTIKLGDTRFDITGGMKSLITLAARWSKQSTKSSITGVVTKFGEGYGSLTGMDIFWNLIEGKLSPIASVIKQIVKQETFEGEKLTVINQLQSLTVPIVLESGFDAYQKEDLATALLVLIADGIGISANTYSYNDNWNVNPGKELIQFKEKVGDEKFKEANKEYIESVNKKIIELKKDTKWIAKDEEEKQQALTAEKGKIKSAIFRQNHFKYRRTK